MVNDKIICKCLSVKYSQIIGNIENGSDNIEKLIKSTGATTCCGGCTSEILRILKRERNNK